MHFPLYQVDAFTSRLFRGNPAAVVPMNQWLPDELLQAIAAENNLAETAFFAPSADGYDIRWFTPTASRRTRNLPSNSGTGYAVLALESCGTIPPAKKSMKGLTPCRSSRSK